MKNPARCVAAEPAELPGPVLAIDTSLGLAVGLVGGGVEPIRLQDLARRQDAERLAPLVRECLAAAGRAVADVAAIAVGVGPATFTGLRVGLVTARTLAHVTGCPVWGVPSLDVTAASAASGVFGPQAGPLGGARALIVARDAKRRELFTARYELGPGSVLARQGGPAVGALEASGPSRGAVVVGDLDEARAYGLLPPDVETIDRPELGVIDPVQLALLAAARAAGGEPVPADPLYLRRPDVQEPAARKRASR